MKDLLIRHAKRQAQSAALGLATAAAGALAAEGIKRVLPEIQIGNGSDMVFLCRLLSEKPGAPKGPLAEDGGQERWSFGFGHLIFQEGGHWFYASRTASKNGSGGSEPAEAKSIWDSAASQGRPRAVSRSETNGFLCIRALTGGEASLKALVRGARERFLPEKEVAVYNWEGGWNHLENKPPRPLSTVAVEGDLAQRLLEDIAAFQRDEPWYKSHHVPYRRGYLLYGPPGSGKSTLAGALAAEAGLNICVLSLADKDLDDNRFVQALRQMRRNSILLLEDVDAVNAQTERRVPGRYDEVPAPDISQEQAEAIASDLRKSSGIEEVSAGDLLSGWHTTAYTPPGKLTLAGILNALDGLTTPSGLIVMMTTNHREKLDPALIRPGRVDVHAEIGLATRSQVRDLFLRFFPDHGDLADSFADTIRPHTTSPATIQEHLVRHRYLPEEAALGLKAFA